MKPSTDDSPQQNKARTAAPNHAATQIKVIDSGPATVTDAFFDIESDFATERPEGTATRVEDTFTLIDSTSNWT